MAPSPPTSRLQAVLICCFTTAIGVACAALVGAAIVVPAPSVALPLIAAMAIGCPAAVWSELRRSIGVLRDPRLGPLRRRHLDRLRRELERLPEAEHPLEP